VKVKKAMLEVTAVMSMKQEIDCHQTLLWTDKNFFQCACEVFYDV
jgi:hypothetical protein